MADRWASRRGYPCGGTYSLQWQRSQAAGRGGGESGLRVPRRRRKAGEAGGGGAC
jgi:hypothetical protein